MLLDSGTICFNSGIWCVCVYVFFFAGALYPTSMRINKQGCLVVNFRTKARFRGLFVESHSGGRAGEVIDPNMSLLS